LGGVGSVQNDGHTGKPLQTANVMEMRLGVTYRAFCPMLSGLLGVLANNYFPSMLVATGTMTIELTVANATQVCVAGKPTRAIVNNAAPDNYYPSQQQYLAIAAQNNDANPVNAVCINNGATTASLRGWTEASYNVLSLSVEI
jgi:hypothetical protein